MIRQISIRYWDSNLVKEDHLTQIYGTSYPNDHIARPNFLPCHHGWKFTGSSSSVDLPHSYLLCFTHFDTASVIFAVVSSSSSKVFWVTKLISLGSWRGGWPSRRSFLEVGSPYPIISLALSDGNDLILTSVSTQIFLISFSVTPEEISPGDLGSEMDNSEVDQWWGILYTPLYVYVWCFPITESYSR